MFLSNTAYRRHHEDGYLLAQRCFENEPLATPSNVLYAYALGIGSVLCETECRNRQADLTLRLRAFSEGMICRAEEIGFPELVEAIQNQVDLAVSAILGLDEVEQGK